MNPQLLDRVKDLPDYLGGHMVLSLAALLVGLAISLPLGILACRRPRLGEVTLGMASVIQTIPSLALLALMVPLLKGMIGFVPAFIALTLYSILPILANTIIGIKGVDSALTEAARGLGMNNRQMLFRVELPLAAPVIISGIRTATVLVVGTAVLAAEVGEPTLGSYIFEGLNTRNHLSTVFGCVVAALLAVVMDQIIHILELSARRRDRRLAWIGAAGLLLVVGGGLYRPVSKLIDRAEHVKIASGPFTEQHILSEVLARTVSEHGFKPDQRKNMGETIQFDALRQSKVDCCVDYSGNIWAVVMKRKETLSPRETLDQVTSYLQQEHGILCLGSLGFENAYALAVRRDFANRLRIHSLPELAQYTHFLGSRNEKLIIGGDQQIFRRPEWQKVVEAYQLNEAVFQTRPMNETLMYSAIKEGTVDAIVAYTSDGRIQAFDLEILKDPHQAFPPYDAILLVSQKGAKKARLIVALRSLIDRISLRTMQAANAAVDVERLSIRLAAQGVLDEIFFDPRKW